MMPNGEIPHSALAQASAAELIPSALTALVTLESAETDAELWVMALTGVRTPEETEYFGSAPALELSDQGDRRRWH
jgi:hypothetical protein